MWDVSSIPYITHIDMMIKKFQIWVPKITSKIFVLFERYFVRAFVIALCAIFKMNMNTFIKIARAALGLGVKHYGNGHIRVIAVLGLRTY